MPPKSGPIGRRHLTLRPGSKAISSVAVATRIFARPSPSTSAIVGGPPQYVGIESGRKGVITRRDAKSDPSWLKAMIWFEET